MSLTFDGTAIKCGHLHSPLMVTAGDVQRRETYFWGLRGVSEIVATPGGWDAHCMCWLNDSTFQDPGGLTQLRNYVKSLREIRGDHGDLIETTSESVTLHHFTEATFLGFEAVAFDGHRHTAGPIKDDANGVNGGWILQGELRWRLLTDEQA